MHIIHSNPWGFRIHSPFVFQLVTRGLYRKSTSKENIFSFPGSFSRAERKYAALLINLIQFLQPEDVVPAGGNDPVHQWMAANWRFLVDKKNKTGDQQAIQCCRIILHSGFPPEVKPDNAYDVWVMACLKKKENKTRHKILTVEDEVRVTLESKLIDILFFHPLLQKEHYKIHGWFYIWPFKK